MPVSEKRVAKVAGPSTRSPGAILLICRAGEPMLESSTEERDEVLQRRVQQILRSEDELHYCYSEREQKVARASATIFLRCCKVHLATPFACVLFPPAADDPEGQRE
ncbi:hypothetical protein Nepgr_014672 [Nepenthes gracilis]|uniref:Uncharacterized protein n=1 Tax=Nepenthes gracilis TaxID=150966 RepID=A0AAD3SLH9_NEPGR|nr:hypothetical protein Nepgr_014672 [Nepenthes gracilis]